MHERPFDAGSPSPVTDSEDQLRNRALVRLKHKARFRSHATWYAIANLGHVAIWAATGATSVFFWPAFPAVVWGVFLALHWHNAYRRDGRTSGTPNEAWVRREMDALRFRDAP